MRVHLIRALPLLCAAAVLGGCVTSKSVRIESDPPGAEIFVNDTFAGTAPLNYTLIDDNTPGVVDDYTIEARLPGYKTAVKELRDQMGTSWMPDQVVLPLQADGAPPSAPSAAARTGDARVTVPADADWVISGVRVQAGETLDIQASGRWKMAAACKETDAAGTGLSYGLFCGSMGGEPIPGVNFQTLIGRVGESGRPFVIGNGIAYTAESAGMLYLRSNSSAMWDNTGAMRVTIARAAPAPQPAPQVARPATPRPSGGLKESAALRLSYPPGAARPDDIAVLIGNGDYGRLGKDIPDVVPAHADLDAFRAFATQALGVREGNIIELKDATSAQLTRVFGSERNPRGQLYDWVKPGRSRVVVYYAGHGAPGGGGGEGGAYLVPVDADSARIELNGYPLSTLYANLAALPAQSVTVVLEACFSGASAAGTVIANASPVLVRAKTPPVPNNLTVIAAGAADQIASWETDQSHGLFTKYYLTAMSGAADRAPFGDGNGRVEIGEVKAYLDDTLTYFARRHYGRDQRAAIFVDGAPLP